MNNWNTYFDNIKDAKCHKNLKLISQIDGSNKFAIELGCGNGRDTVYLLKKRV